MNKQEKGVTYSCTGLTIFVALIAVLTSIYIWMTITSDLQNVGRILIFGVGIFLLGGVVVWLSHAALYWEARKKRLRMERLINFDRQLRHRQPSTRKNRVNR